MGSSIRKKQEKQEKHEKANSSISKMSYFQQARSWADDINVELLASRHRYKIAFYIMSGFAAILVFCIVTLVPLQHTELVVVHNGPSGYVWLSTTTQREHIKTTWAKTQSEIAHYVRARESYDPLLYRYQTKTVNLLSSSEVGAEYALSQSQNNKSAPINVLGAKGYRTVRISNILPIDSSSKNKNGQTTHHNLAQVDFVVSNHYFGNTQVVSTPYSALISWQYDGIPTNPRKELKDWDGFKITKYIVTPMNTPSAS